MSIARRRLSPTASRQLALDAARDILIEHGPQAVTLKAVASRIGRTHANLLHHFGSAADLQKALGAFLAKGVCDQIAERIGEHNEEMPHLRDVVDLAFDAFGAGGAGALASWMLMTGNDGALDPIVESIHELINSLASDDKHKRLLHEDTLALVLMALGDSMIGETLSDALELKRETARNLAAELIANRMSAAFAAE